MITNITINNISAIDHTSISFKKAKYEFLSEYINNGVANPIAIYGKNGSGKSSFIDAFYFLSFAFNAEIDRLYPFVPNFARVGSERKPASIKLDFEINNNSYSYYIETTINGINSEHLYMNDTRLLERVKNKYTIGDDGHSIESNSLPALREACANYKQAKELLDAYNYISNIACIGKTKDEYVVKSFNKIGYLDAMVAKSNEVKKILKTYNDFPLYDIKSMDNPQTQRKDYYAFIETDKGPFNLLYSYISEGMKSQSFLLTTLLSLPSGGCLVIDELEDGLHPLTIKNFINVALERNIQLIFVSHNTNILGSLRPDNIVFANWKNGASSYKRLCDIYPNIREVNNIEKMYLSSLFDKEIEK